MAGVDGAIADADRAGADDEGVLESGAQGHHGPASVQLEVDADVVGVAPRRRGRVVERADEDGGDGVAEILLGQLRMVLERGWAVAGGGRLGDPQLHAVQLTSEAPGSLLGVGDAVAGGHEVDLARCDQLLGAERVAVQRLAREQPCDRLQPDVRVGATSRPRSSVIAAGPM